MITFAYFFIWMKFFWKQWTISSFTMFYCQFTDQKSDYGFWHTSCFWGPYRGIGHPRMKCTRNLFVESNKATKTELLIFSSPQMRAFRMTWFAFFLCFFAWFGIAPLMAVVSSPRQKYGHPFRYHFWSTTCSLFNPLCSIPLSDNQILDHPSC